MTQEKNEFLEILDETFSEYLKNRYFILVDKKPVPVDGVLDWAKMFEDGHRSVRSSWYKEGIIISTVFLGLNHNFHIGPPVLFETMIFGSNAALDGYQTRCCTWDDAVLMHEEARLIVQASIREKQKQERNKK